MTIIQNALKSITRSKARNILIGLIILSVTSASVIALSIKQAANDIIEIQEQQFEIQGALILDRNLLRANYSGSNESMRTMIASVPPLTASELERYSDSEYVTNLSFNLSVEVNSESLIPVGAEESDVSKEGSGAMRAQFTMIGLTAPESYEAFKTGDYRMIEGDVYSLNDSADNVLINEELAITNNLGIGDSIEMISPMDPEFKIGFIISGIYVDQSEDSENSMNWFSKSANQLIAGYDYVLNAYEGSMENGSTGMTGTYNHTFYLTDYDVIEAFENELTAGGLNEYYLLRTNASELDKIMQPLENLNNFTTIFFGLVLVVGGAILLLINMINIRERKYEIGVLRAIGMKKHVVAFQFLTELLIVTLIAMIVGVGIGQILSEPIGNHMLSKEVEQAMIEQDLIATNLGAGNGAGSGSRNVVESLSSEPLEYIEEIKTTLDNWVIIQLLVIGLSIVFVGSLISLITISRYEPLKILSSRS